MAEIGHTPGPWRWELSEKSREARLCGAAGYDLTVVDFVRWGMGGAAPRFRTADGMALNIMHRADEFAVVVPGREHHAEWFKGVEHPDARLIAAAPELLEALYITANCSPVQRDLDAMPDETELTLTFCAADLRQIRAAIAKAVGRG